MRPHRVLAAWALGLAAPMAAVWGSPRVMVTPPLQVRAYLALGLGVGVALAVAASARRRRGAQVTTQAVASLVVPLLTASSVGRLAGLVAVTTSFAAYAAVVEWQPWGDRPPRRFPTASGAVVPLLAGEWAWYRFDSAIAVFVGCAASFAVSEAYHRAAARVEPVESSARAAARWVAGRPAAVGAAVVVPVWRFVRRVATRTATRVHADPGPVYAAIVAAALSSVHAAVFWGLVNVPGRLVAGINDYGPHVDEARAVTFVPFRLEIPQFLFHVASAAVSRVVGDEVGPVVVLVAALWATHLATFVLVRQAWPGRERRVWGWPAVVAASCVLMETPAILLLWLGWVSPNTRFLTIQVLYSPTWVVALPFAVAVLAGLGRILDHPPGVGDRARPAAGPTRARLAFAVLVAVGAMAKPSFALALIPGLAVHLVLLERRPLREAVSAWLWVAVPGGAVIAWQLWFLSTSTSEFGSDGFTFDPISGPVFGWSEARWAFWLPLLWLPLAAWAAGRAFLADRQVRIVACSWVFGVAAFVLFRETGPRATHGNLGVPAQVCTTLLVLLSVRAIAARVAAVRAGDGRFGAWLLPAGFLGAACLAAGAVALAGALGWTEIPIDWRPFF